MALIQKEFFTELSKQRNSIHKTVEATYCSFRMGDKIIFQIDTYGSADRKMPEKISQSIQIDYEMAKILIQILKKEFNLK